MKGGRIRSLSLVVVVTAAISTLMLAGCAKYWVRYQAEVTKSVFQEGVPEPARPSSDGGLEVHWRIESSSLIGVFSNLENTEGKILWEGAMFSYGGESEPLILIANFTNLQLHRTPDLPQPPTTIPPNGLVKVETLPLSCIKWQWFSSQSGAFWKIRPLIGIRPTHEQSKKERQQLAETAIGQQFTIHIPIQLDDKILVHEFHFRIVSANVYKTIHIFE